MKCTQSKTSFVLAAAVLVPLLLTGCGGGGGSSSPTAVSSLTISGTVFQADGTTPLPNAKVVFDTTGPSTTTNQSGQYTLSIPHQVSIGSHTLTIEQVSGSVAAPVLTETIQVTSSTATGVNATVPSTTPPPPPPAIPPSVRMK